MTSPSATTALVRRGASTSPGLLARIRSAVAMWRAAGQVTTTSTIGWTVVRGSTPSDFQGTGNEVRLHGWERHPVVHACVRAIADLIAAVPLEAYRKRADGTAEVIAGHPVLAVFAGEGDGRQSEFRLKGRTAAHFLTYGNAFWHLERAGARRGLPRSVRVITPDAVQYVWLDGTDRIGAYDWRDLQGVVHARTPAEDVVHFRDLDASDGLFGYPRGAAALRSMLADSEASEYVRQVVTNHGTPGIAVMVDGNPTPEELEAGRSRWQERWVERGQRGGAAFMAGVKEMVPIGFNLQQLEFPDLRAVSREDICTAFAVDRRIIGITSGTSDGGLSGEQFREARHRLIQQAVYPVMRAMEDEINRVLTPEFGEVWVRFSEEYIAAITEDVTQTSTRVLAEVAGKVRTVEEAREAIGLDAEMPADHTYPGGMKVGAAAENAQQLAEAALEAARNPMPALGAGASEGEDDDTPEDEEAPMRALVRAFHLPPDEAAALWRTFDETARKAEGPYERTALTLFRAEAEDIARIIATLTAAHAIMDDPFVAAALARIEANYGPGRAYHEAWLKRYLALIRQTVEVGGTDVAARTGIRFDLENPRAEAVIRARAGNLVKNVTETTKASIRAEVLAAQQEGVGPRQLAKRIEEATFGEISAARAMTIARTETVGALNAGAYQAAVQSGVLRSKRWITQGDEKVRGHPDNPNTKPGGPDHYSLDGQTIDIGAAFPNGLRYPHDPDGKASEVINCRCSLAYSHEDAGAVTT